MPEIEPAGRVVDLPKVKKIVTWGKGVMTAKGRGVIVTLFLPETGTDV